ncbi:hypothetical protein HDU91_003368 [Kappamyces sp. JEL0680]|nr:hypothetical protein HDU91_003368 [Kappamyces sp. JEL0680]
MRFLVRNIPPADIAAHVVIVSLVLTSWGFLLYAAFILPLSSYSHLFNNAYARMVSPDPIFPGLNSAWCFSAPEIYGFVATEERSTANFCQLNFANFTNLCNLFGVQMTDAERKIFFTTLDLTGNGLLSWGELAIDFFGTQEYAFTYYVKRWRQMTSLGMSTGLERIQDFDYEPFRYVYSDCFLWGKRCLGDPLATA